MERKDPKGHKPSVDAYRKTDVFTANRETILLMMYAGAIRFLRQAIEAAEKDDALEKTRLIKKTQDIVNELRSVLNFEAGGDIARNLDRLYAFVSNRLIEGSFQKKIEYLREALGVLTTLNESWEQAIAKLKKEHAQAEK